MPCNGFASCAEGFLTNGAPHGGDSAEIVLAILRISIPGRGVRERNIGAVEGKRTIPFRCCWQLRPQGIWHQSERVGIMRRRIALGGFVLLVHAVASPLAAPIWTMARSIAPLVQRRPPL